MKIKSIRNAKNLVGATVFLRVDFNVPLKNGKIIDDLRIIKSLPDIHYLIEHRCKIIIATHLGRPEGRVQKKLSTKILADHLSKIIKKPIKFLDTGDLKKISAAGKLIQKAKPDSIFFLENLRFNKGEGTNDHKFAEALASLAQIYINDAFSVSHRAEASVSAIKKYLPSYAGLLLIEELVNLNNILKPKKPFVIVLGGSKIETKLPLLKHLAPVADKILIGGGVANNFLLAKGLNIGNSIYDKANVALAKSLLNKFSKKIVMPLDLVVTSDFKKGVVAKNPHLFVRDTKSVKKSEFIGDIGPDTIGLYAPLIKKAKTIVWNGPLGMCEVAGFKTGTLAIARLIATRSRGVAFGLVGGGETEEAVRLSGMEEYIDWVSTGGGAMLAYLGKEPMPGLEGLVN